MCMERVLTYKVIVKNEAVFRRRQLWHLRRIQKAAYDALSHPDIRDTLIKSDVKFERLWQFLMAYRHILGGR